MMPPLDGATFLAEAERSLGGEPTRGDCGDPACMGLQLIREVDAHPEIARAPVAARSGPVARLSDHRA
ncbi:hypothetical protein [Parvibaculum sp.]|uniref:hypothetical protein n=1 Tax=Parvibaculum sp. TaxID=2024848 RepID=UPI003BA8FF78